MKGKVFNIQKFCTEDGPGIRTTVFLKGCPLKCRWCQNPEGISIYSQLGWSPSKCIRCMSCIERCDNKAIYVKSNKILTDSALCSTCGKCIAVCPTNARELIGSWQTIEEIVDEVIKDKVFYEQSGGGITLSGGEPLFQAEFAMALLKEFKISHIHTAIETSGYCSPDIIEGLLPYLDLIIYDIKLMCPKKHLEYTGGHLDVILDNFWKLCKADAPVWVRTPIIPGYTDTVENIRKVTQYIQQFPNVTKYELVPFNELAEAKYEKLQIDNNLDVFKVMGSSCYEVLQHEAKRHFKLSDTS